MEPEGTLRSKNGRKLPYFIVLKKRIMNLYYQVPTQMRSHLGGIPAWFSEAYHLPKYLFRLSGKTFSPKQTCISMLSRLYYMYRYRLNKTCWDNTAYLHQVSSERLIGSCLSQVYSRPRWYPTIAVAYRRLKVLLCPFIGPST